MKIKVNYMYYFNQTVPSIVMDSLFGEQYLLIHVSKKIDNFLRYFYVMMFSCELCSNVQLILERKKRMEDKILSALVPAAETPYVILRPNTFEIHSPTALDSNLCR